MTFRLYLLAVVGLVGCKIADTHFIGLAGDDDARSDGIGGDTRLDGPTANASKLYAADTTGIYLVDRDRATGLLTFNRRVSTQATIGIAIDATGHTLYATDPTTTMVQPFAIQPDGSLTALQASSVQQCNPAYAAVAPNGGSIVFGCSNGRIVYDQIGAGGTLANGAQYPVGNSPTRPAFSAGGNCVYVADETGSVLGSLQELRVTGVTLSALGPGVGPNPARGIATVPGLLFVSGPGSLFRYTMTEAGCTATVSPTTGFPIGQDPRAIVVDPTNRFVLVLGQEIYAFAITGNTLVQAGGPYLASTTIMAGAMDSALPHVLYLARPTTGGSSIEIANVDDQGAVTMTSSITIPASGPTTLQLAP